MEGIKMTNKLNKNQKVFFEDGHSEGYLEARWSEKKQAFVSFVEVEDEDGYIETVQMFSNDVRTFEPKAKKKFIPNEKNCTVQIYPFSLKETEKAYAINDGSNGLVGKRMKAYYKYIAKSVCYVDNNGNIFAPCWAL